MVRLLGQGVRQGRAVREREVAWKRKPLRIMWEAVWAGPGRLAGGRGGALGSGRKFGRRTSPC